ncbi:MAG TPA: hypothetical protein DD417_16160 [Elusimicrobia bacterium]|nr:hypothetical protein [Elusimicrobiota bacterium]
MAEENDILLLRRAIAELQLELASVRSEVRRLGGRLPEKKSGPVKAEVPPPAPAMEEPVPVLCPRCHAPVDRGDAFCDQCGASTLDVKPSPARLRPPAPKKAEPELKIDWERFMGVKLFAWVGGFALFLGVIFFVKYAFENNLISPSTRVALGMLVGIGAIVGGLWLRPRGYAVTVETLCAAGIAILYGDAFASRAFYRLGSPEVAFGLMSLITGAAFVLSVRLGSRYVSILGLVGGFLTPPLLSTGVDHAVALFSYVTILNVGLAAVALRMKWDFLVPLAAGATLLMEIGWTRQFFSPDKETLLAGIILWFCAFFLGAAALARRRDHDGLGFHLPAAALPLFCLGFSAYLLSFQALGSRPILQFVLLNLLNLQLAYAALRREEPRPLYIIGGVFSFVILSAWTNRFLTGDILNAALACFLAFAVIHAAAPAAIQRLRPDRSAWNWGYAFPGLVLALLVFAIHSQRAVGFLVWPTVMVLGMVALALAWFAAAAWAAVAALALVVGAFAAWMLRLPDAAGVIQILPLLGVFILAFFAWPLYLARTWVRSGGEKPKSGEVEKAGISAAELAACAAIMPFFLLVAVCGKVPLPDPSPVFGLVFLLDILLLGIVRFRKMDAAALVALAGTVMVQAFWHGHNFQAEAPAVALCWYSLFYLVFLLFPLLLCRGTERLGAWRAAAAAGPLQYLLVYRAVSLAVGRDYIGAVPAAYAASSLAALMFARAIVLPGEGRKSVLAYLGGVALFFITLIIPVQFQKEWITFGWALEGAALVWLYSRVPHPGLKAWGAGLLLVAFARLALNPAVLSYHPRTSAPLWNWYLLVYGVSAACMWFAAPRFSADEDRVQGVPVGTYLNVFGVVLAFLLMNIEIADFFSKGPAITFDFSGSFSQDMTYSLAWALFSIALVGFGIARSSQGARYGGLALLVATIGKVFLHDLWRLGQLYRVASIVGLAVVLILVSFVYQRFLNEKTPA